MKGSQHRKSSLKNGMILAVTVLLFISLLTGCGLLSSPTATSVPVKPTAKPADKSFDVVPSPTATEVKVQTATLSEIAGGVVARQPNQADFLAAANGLALQARGQVKTENNGKARLDLTNGSILRVGPSTLFTYEGEDKRSGEMLTRMKLDLGTLWVILKGGAIDVTTPSGIAGVRGSYLSISVDPVTNEVYVTCLEGTCSLGNAAGSVNITTGQTAKITNATTPPTRGVISDSDIRKWLEMNPEATVIVPTLTAVATQRATPVPTATPTPSGPTPVPVVYPSPVATLPSGTVPTRVP